MTGSATTKALVADSLDPSAIDALRDLGLEVDVDPSIDADTLSGALERTGAAILIVRSTKVPADALRAATDLRLVIRAGSGYDTIDVEAAGERGIAVCNCPGMNAAAVAELTMAHLLALDRRLVDQTNELRGGHWDKKAFSKARGLKNRTLLVVGTGSIGTEVVQRAQAFGMRVLAQSRSLRADTARALGIEPVPYTREALHEALAEADAVTIHVSRRPETENLCDADFFAAMRPGAYFINTSRGEIVDELALAWAVRERGIRAAVDVYRDQPSAKDCEWSTPLAELDGVFFSHHCGASTDQAQEAVAAEVVRIVQSYLEQGDFLHLVNGDVLATG